MVEMSQTDLLVLSAVPLLLTFCAAVAGKVVGGTGQSLPWPSSGFVVARRIIEASGERVVRVEPLGGGGEDHFDRRLGELRLRDAVYHGRSVFAAANAAYSAAWYVLVAGRRITGMTDTAASALVQFGTPAGLLAMLLGATLRLGPLSIFGCATVYIAFGFDLLWLPLRLWVAVRAIRLLCEDAKNEPPPRTVVRRCVLGSVLSKSSGVF